VELKDAILGYLAISFFYQALLSPLAMWINSPRLTDAGRALISIATSMVLPAAVGLLFGLDAQKGWTRWLFKNLRVNLSHPVDTAWDWRLGQEECWVHVKLKDGTNWAGHLGEGSFSSTDPNERDLYIEHVYSTGKDDKNWTPRGSGVWIGHGEIQTIEFWPEHREQIGGEPAAIPEPNEGEERPAVTDEGTAAASERGRGEMNVTLKLEGVAYVETPR
jgi:hypothetical protein